ARAVRRLGPHPPKHADPASTERSAAPPRRNQTAPDSLLRRRPRVWKRPPLWRCLVSRAPNPQTLPKAVLAALKGDPAIAGARTFAEQAAADAAPDELPELSTAELGANLADFWRFGERRRGRGP